MGTGPHSGTGPDAGTAPEGALGGGASDSDVLGYQVAFVLGYLVTAHHDNVLPPQRPPCCRHYHVDEVRDHDHCPVAEQGTDTFVFILNPVASVIFYSKQ